MKPFFSDYDLSFLKAGGILAGLPVTLDEDDKRTKEQYDTAYAAKGKRMYVLQRKTPAHYGLYVVNEETKQVYELITAQDIQTLASHIGANYHALAAYVGTPHLSKTIDRSFPVMQDNTRAFNEFSREEKQLFNEIFYKIR